MEFSRSTKSLFALILLFLFSVETPFAEQLDLDRDGKGELAVFRSGLEFIQSPTGTSSQISCGAPGDIPIQGRFSTSGAEIALWNPSFGVWQLCRNGLSTSHQWGLPGDIPVPGDYDGNGLTDLAVFRPSNGEWFIRFNRDDNVFPDSTSIQFGIPADIPVPGDYDGDGKSDLAVFRHSSAAGGALWIIRTASGSESVHQFGLAGDLPVPADYNADGVDEIAVWRPSTGTWFVLTDDGRATATQFGLKGDIPSPSDYNGDGTFDFVLYRPESGIWFVRTEKGELFQVQWGLPGDRVANTEKASLLDRRAVGDFNGDRKTDLSLVRINQADLLEFFFHTGTSLPHPTPFVQFGKLGDQVVARDYDGDGVTDLATVRFENGTAVWRFRLWRDGFSSAAEFSLAYGFAGDAIIPADYDGDYKADLAVTRNLPDGSKLWIPNHSGLVPAQPVSWGFAGDTALSADMDGDLKSDFVVVRAVGNQLLWLVRTANGVALEPRLFGFTGDQPIVGDFRGLGRAQIGVRRSSSGFVLHIIAGEQPFVWGLDGDISTAGDFTGDGKLEQTAWRTVNAQGYFFTRGIGGGVARPFGVLGDTPLDPLGVTIPEKIETEETQNQDNSDSQSDATNNANDSSGSGAKLRCASRSNANQQESGFVFKPRSEKNGNLVVLFGASRRGRVKRAALVEERPGGDRVIETLDFSGNTNGGRPTFRASKPGRSYPSGVVLVRQDQQNRVHCIVVPNPGSRTAT